MFEKPKAELIKFDIEDIITTSGCDGYSCDAELPIFGIGDSEND